MNQTLLEIVKYTNSLNESLSDIDDIIKNIIRYKVIQWDSNINSLRIDYNKLSKASFYNKNNGVIIVNAVSSKDKTDYLKKVNVYLNRLYKRLKQDILRQIPEKHLNNQKDNIENVLYMLCQSLSLKIKVGKKDKSSERAKEFKDSIIKKLKNYDVYVDKKGDYVFYSINNRGDTDFQSLGFKQVGVKQYANIMTSKLVS